MSVGRGYPAGQHSTVHNYVVFTQEDINRLAHGKLWVVFAQSVKKRRLSLLNTSDLRELNACLEFIRNILYRRNRAIEPQHQRFFQPHVAEHGGSDLPTESHFAKDDG